MKFSYRVLSRDENRILIQDTSENKMCSSVTNAAEDVIKDLVTKQLINKDVRVFYVDTLGNTDELCHNGQSFTGYRSGSNNE
jgi:hypothetical protein